MEGKEKRENVKLSFKLFLCYSALPIYIYNRTKSTLVTLVALNLCE